MVACRKSLAYIPVLLVGMVTLLLIVTYTISVARGDVTPWLPYLSYLGMEPPASFIFSFLLYISSILVLIGAYVRYKVVVHSDDLSKRCQRINKAGLVMSVMVGVGMFVVASVKINEVYSIHMMGAGLIFWPSVVYCILQTVLSYLLLTPLNNGIALCRVRLVVSLLAVVNICTCLISSIVAFHGWSSNPNHHGDDKEHWKPGDGGYDAHIVSVISEWAMIALYVAFFLTFIPEFHKFHLKVTLVSSYHGHACVLGKEKRNRSSYQILSGSEEEEEEDAMIPA